MCGCESMPCVCGHHRGQTASSMLWRWEPKSGPLEQHTLTAVFSDRLIFWNSFMDPSWPPTHFAAEANNLYLILPPPQFSAVNNRQDHVLASDPWRQSCRTDEQYHTHSPREGLQVVIRMGAMLSFSRSNTKNKNQPIVP